jgi:hypothetical protein
LRLTKECHSGQGHWPSVVKVPAVFFLPPAPRKTVLCVTEEGLLSRHAKAWFLKPCYACFITQMCYFATKKDLNVVKQTNVYYV